MDDAMLPSEASKEWNKLSQDDIRRLMHLLMSNEREKFNELWYELTHCRDVERLLDDEEAGD